MVEGELPGVEEKARGGERVFFPVNGIAEDGGADVVEMDADLVGAAGVEVAQDERGLGGGIGGERFVIRDRGLAAGWIDDGHFLAVHWVATDVREDRFLVRLGDAVRDCEVELLHGGALGKLGDEALVGGIGFRDDEATGGVFV